MFFPVAMYVYFDFIVQCGSKCVCDRNICVNVCVSSVCVGVFMCAWH